MHKFGDAMQKSKKTTVKTFAKESRQPFFELKLSLLLIYVHGVYVSMNYGERLGEI
jgi:hypothetical protein